MLQGQSVLETGREKTPPQNDAPPGPDGCPEADRAVQRARGLCRRDPHTPPSRRAGGRLRSCTDCPCAWETHSDL